jgi:hypothetical protein
LERISPGFETGSFFVLQPKFTSAISMLLTAILSVAGFRLYKIREYCITRQTLDYASKKTGAVHEKASRKLQCT